MAIIEEANQMSDGTFVFSLDDDWDEADTSPASIFEKGMAAQADAAALSAASWADASRDVPISAQTADVLSAYSQEQGFKEITVQQAYLLCQSDSKVFLLDVRTREEYASSHAEGAVNVPLDELTAAVKRGDLPPPDSQVCIICQSGRRSAQAAVKLGRVHNYSDVANVQGGTTAWAGAGLPIKNPGLPY